MVSDRMNVPSSPQPDDIKQDFLHLLLGDDTSYPWQPELDTAQSFFTRLEGSWIEGQTTDELETIDHQGKAFFAQLEQSWPTSPQLATTSINLQLAEHFGDRIPQGLLDCIAQQAKILINTQQPLADQLVNCVQTILSEWSTEDLFVLARPYAYAMRGNNTDTLEAALRSVRYAAWTELSGVEQARLSLAIARYTLSQLSTSDMQ